MIRLLFFIVVLIVASTCAAWFIENDGSIVVEWMGYRIQTSVGFAIIFGVVVIALCTMVLESFLWVRSLPGRYSRKRKERQRERGIAALTEGFAAIASGDAKNARRLTNRAESCLGTLPVTKLLSAQTSQLEGNKEQARQAYSGMLEHKETEIIAIKGLLLQAREEGDIKKAIFLAEKAADQAKNAEWPIAILLDLYKLSADWDKLEKTIDRALDKKIIERKDAMHLLCVCALAKASIKKQSGDAKAALSLALSALKLSSDSIQALIYVVKLHFANEEPKQAIKQIEKHWSKAHHPALLALYLEAFENESHENALKKAEKLNAKSTPLAENFNVLARFAMRTSQMEKADGFIKESLALHETQEAALLHAELLRRENADMDSVTTAENRAINAEKGAAWHCGKCAHTTAHWEPICPHCHQFDGLVWGRGKPVYQHSSDATALVTS